MNKNWFSYFFIFFTIVTCYSEGLSVTTFEEATHNFKAIVNPVKDANGDNCCVIMINHNITEEVHLAGNEIYKREVDTSQIVYFWISKWEKNITITAHGYLPIQYSFPLSLKEGKSYKLVLVGEQENVDVFDIPIKIDTQPSGATVYIDEVKISSTTPFSEFFDSGIYPLKIELENYKTYESFINIATSGIDTTYVLEPNFGTLIIKSKPEVNMIVSVNDQEVGQTPLTLPMQPSGKCVINSYSEFYHGREVTYFLENADTLLVELEPISDSGTLTIKSIPDAEIYINNTKTKKIDNLILSPQTVTIKAVKKKHRDAIEKLILRKGEFKEIEVLPELISGDVLVNPIPDSTKVELYGEDGEYFQQVGISKFSNIPYGKYNLVLTCKQHLPYQQKINLKEGDRLRFDIELVKASYKFTLDFPQELAEDVNILVYDSDMNETPYTSQDNQVFYLEKAGVYNIVLRTDERIIFSKFVNIDIKNSPQLNLRYMKFIAPSLESRIYLNKKLINIQKEIITAVEVGEKIIVKIDTPKATDFEYAKVFKETDRVYSVKKLIKNIDYREYTNHYGIAFSPGDKKIFYGLKLPIIISPYYQQFNGLEVNLFSGNYGPTSGIYKFEGGQFNGINISIIGGTIRGDMNGISLASLANITDNNHCGLQISLINYAKILRGVQIGLINITSKESKSLRFSPIINLGF